MMMETREGEQSPGKETSPLLTDLETLQAEAEGQESETPKPPKNFFHSGEGDPAAHDVSALVGDHAAQILIEPAYDVVGYFVDRPTLREYIPDSAKGLHGTLLDLTIRKYFPGESLFNYPELLLALSAGAVIAAAMEKAPTSAQLRGGHVVEPDPGEEPKPPKTNNTTPGGGMT